MVSHPNKETQQQFQKESVNQESTVERPKADYVDKKIDWKFQ